MNTIKVQHLFNKEGEYLEIWKEVRGKRYFGRTTFGVKEWVHVCDAPYGYCEVSHPCSPDKVFTVCDDKGKALFDSRNGDNSSQFDSIEELSKKTWESVKDAIPEARRDGHKTWLKQFLTEDVYTRIPVGSFCIEDNFLDFWHDIVQVNKITDFDWIGSGFRIIEVVKKSRYCDVSWIEYYTSTTDEDDMHTIKYHAWRPLTGIEANKEAC